MFAAVESGSGVMLVFVFTAVYDIYLYSLCRERTVFTIESRNYEASSLLLEVTAGCTHHRCKLCMLYADLPFLLRMSR